MLTKPMANYPHTRQVGSLVFLAGQGCRAPETNECCGLRRSASGDIEGYDIQAQTSGVLANVERALQAVGLDRRALVDVQVFLKDMNDFAKMNEVWDAFFAECSPPTRTTVAVVDLPGDNFIEMKAIAAATQET